MHDSHPRTVISPEVTNRHLLKWMFGFVRPVKISVFLTCLFLGLRIAAEILAVRQTAEAVNQIKAVHVSGALPEGGFRAWIVGSDPAVAGLRRVILLLGGFTLALGIFIYLREVSNAKLSMKMVFYMREAVYDKLQRVGFGFHDAISTGELINRCLTDLQNVRLFLNSSMLISLEIVLIVGGYIVVLTTRSPWVAALSLVPIPVWTWYILRFSRRVQPAQRAVMEAGDKNVSALTENIAGVHVVKAFATEQQEIARYNRTCDTFCERVMARIRLYANFTPVIRSIAMASHLSLFLAAGILMIKGMLDAGDVLLLGAAMGAILGRLQQVSVINEQYQNAIVSARRLHEVLMAEATVDERWESGSLSPGRGTVVFDRVTFGYDPAKPVLHDISFRVEGGSVVAIVGPTGAGKTTLVNLMARFYDPQKGRILIDGMDIREVSLENLRQQIAFVFQETYLFSDSVEANVAYSRPGFHGADIQKAARLAQAHEFIERLPRGYQTVLEERGATLSGGQRQRLAIARAILAGPRILVLDDAMAAVDPETEVLIGQGMRSVMRDRTTFVIAHRISTVKQADLVIVLENGRLTQTGTHDELMEEDGHYRDIAMVQLFGDQIERDVEGDIPSHMDRVRDPRRVDATAGAAKGVDEAGTETSL